MVEALIAVGTTLVLAIIGSTWRLGTRIGKIDAKLERVSTSVSGITERLDRVNVEVLRERVTRLEEQLSALRDRG